MPRERPRAPPRNPYDEDLSLAPVLLATTAHALVLCTTPDGKTYAGDTPPADSKVKGEYTSSDALREREAELLGKIGGARRAFGELTEMVARTHGGIAPRRGHR